MYCNIFDSLKHSIVVLVGVQNVYFTIHFVLYFSIWVYYTYCIGDNTFCIARLPIEIAIRFVL